MVINRRFLAITAWCQELAIPVAVLAVLVTAGSPANNSYARITADMEAVSVPLALTRSIDAPAEATVLASAATDFPAKVAETSATVPDIQAKSDDTPASSGPVLAALEMPIERQRENRLAEPDQTNGHVTLPVDEAIEQVQSADEGF